MTAGLAGNHCDHRTRLIASRSTFFDGGVLVQRITTLFLLLAPLFVAWGESNIAVEPLCRRSPERCLTPWPANLEGWKRVEKIPAHGVVIDSLVIVSRDAFDDTEVISTPDRTLFQLANHLHWETRPSVIRRVLPFSPGDTVQAEALFEAERYLRQQPYLNDASLELWENADGRHLLRAVTSDRFTLSVPLSLSRPDEKWHFTFGLQEFNLLGTGNQLGGMFARTEERDHLFGFFYMPHFLLLDQRLEVRAFQNSDGYQGEFSLQRPFTTIATRWAWGVEGMVQEQDDRWAVERGDRQRLSAVTSREELSGEDIYLLSDRSTLPVATLREIYSDSLSLRFSHAAGDDRFKSYIRFSWDRWTREKPNRIDTTFFALPVATGENENDTLFGIGSFPQKWWSRRDSRIGARHTLRSFRYKRVQNLRNVRWTEDLELGWSIYNGVSRNFRQLGADRDEWRLEHNFWLQEEWNHRLFFMLDVGAHYYLHNTIQDGWLGATTDLTIQKMGGRFSTNLKGNFQSYFADGGTRQLRLGGGYGLDGFPVDWMVGRSTITTSFEERWKPDFELGTVVPLLAAFVRSGGAWSGIDRINLREMESAAGVGMRFGLSKSVKGVVNYIDLSWPLTGALADGLSGWRFSIVAHSSL